VAGDGAEKFLEQLLLAVGLVGVVLQDVAPDGNQRGRFQLEVLGKCSFLDSTKSTIGQLVLALFGTSHSAESVIGFLECQTSQLVGSSLRG
jgi:hypothetical protein